MKYIAVCFMVGLLLFGFSFLTVVGEYGNTMGDSGQQKKTQDLQTKSRCAEEWLKKAIDLHELHMEDPTTTTDDSQMELMDQIKQAYKCLTGKNYPMDNRPMNMQ